MTFIHRPLGRGLVGTLLLAVGVIAACGGGTGDAPPTTPTIVVPTPTVPPDEPSEPPPEVITITMQDPGAGHDYAFAPSALTFKVGQTVELAFVAESEFHTFTVEGLGIAVLVDGGITEHLTYTFEQEGTFGIICVPHESLGMVGTLTVVP